MKLLGDLGRRDAIFFFKEFHQSHALAKLDGSTLMKPSSQRPLNLKLGSVI
jgi:hypothetical protein